MSFKENLVGICIAIFFSVFALFPLFEENTKALEHPQKLYEVYLNGNSIGIIRSKDALEKYINNEQTVLKEKYNVDTVYLPQGLYIADYTGYSKNILTEKEIYKKIKDKAPFTIKGWVLTIGADDPIKIYALKKQDFYDAANNVVKAFVPQDQVDAYRKGEIQEIKTVGSNIESLYLKEQDSVKEALIPSDEKIFDNVKDLTRYMLFGNLDEPDQYTVKPGDTVDSVAYDHLLGTDELLVVNPDISSANALLYPGEKLNVALISPIITIVEEKNVVEDNAIKYKTVLKYDSTKPYGTIEVTQQGTDGLERVTQKIKYENGKIVTVVITNSQELTPAIDKIEVRGTYSETGPIEVGDSDAWLWPTITPYIISSPYGYRWGVLHDGVDIAGCGYGSPIYAANGGNVYSIGYYPTAGGNQIIVNHNNGYYTLYAHLSKIYVTTGQAVKRGQIIGLMGATGNATGTHLHFGTWKGIPYKEGSISFNALTLYR